MANDLKEGRPGISFSSYMGNFGNTTPEINSGFSFDLPLAVVNDMSQSALSFLRGNTQQNQALFTNVVGQSQNQVTNTANRAFQYQENAMGAIQGMSQQFGDTLNNAIEKRRGWCFITTAICESENKPDDCDELETLRFFRDGVMRPSPELSKLVDQYYEIAPSIVEGISQRKDAKKCWGILREAYLNDAVKAVKEKRYDEALTIYLDMVNSAVIFAGEETTNG